MKSIEYNYLKTKISINWQKVMPIGGIGFATVLIGLFLFSFVNTLGRNKIDEQASMEIDGFVEKERTEWWNSEYKYYKRLSIQNLEDFESLDSGAWVELKLDHKAMVDEKLSLSDGTDMQILYKSKETEFEKIDFVLNNPNSSESTATFKLKNSIESFQKDFDYFLYFGTYTPEKIAIIDYVPEITTKNYKIYSSQTVFAPLLISTDRLWVLKSTKEFAQYSEIEIKLSINDDSIDSEMKPQVLIKNKSYDLQQTSDNTFSLKLKGDNFENGEYDIEAYIQDEDIRIESATEKMIVSHPLYVTWTIDWEGYDTGNDTLKQMDEFSAKYEIPMTHFWNPRITIALSAKRQEELLTWLKDRMANVGDSVGLHLHMHFDLVKASGIEKVLDRPHWGGRNNGSDVPTSEYEKEDFEKMIQWSFTQFQKMGLAQPTMYRAGGWYADLEMLEVLADYGFKLDSSGRTQYSLGRDIMPAAEPTTSPTESGEGIDTETSEYIESEFDIPISAPINYDEDLIPWQVEYKVDGHWNLTSTTRPYKVSSYDQNKSNLPTLDIWEFPNNGADSWRFSGEELLKRFTENYSGSYQKESQVLTYLSHPHAINVDIPKLEKAFDYMDRYKIEDDKGPVIFTTLDKCYNDFAQN